MLDKTLLLVDGSSYLYRAFHAMPDLRNALGEPTGAIYGVINMLRRLRNDYKADYLACVFDAKGKTFRDDLYADYKANRAPMPDDLAAQIGPLHDAVRALGWPLLMIEGVEADDVIGTLAQMATREGVKTVVSTGDKDLTQLVNPSVTLVNTMNNEMLDEAGVTQKFGVPPALIVDYLSLIGDTVDNVPGVHKVGPKTAVKWLTQYGSLDAVMAHANEIGGAVGENLRRALEWLPKGRHLLTVKCDVALPAALHDLAAREQDAQTLAALFERYGFKTWLKEVRGGADPAAAPLTDAPAEKVFAEDIPRHYDTLLNEVELLDWMEILARADIVSLDTETTGLDPLQAQLVGMSFSVEPGRAAYLPLAHSGPGVAEQVGVARALELLRPWLEDAAAKKLGQNLKYDQHVFANHGVILRGVAHDTLLESYVLESHMRHDMDSLAARHLGVKTISYDEVTGKGAQRIGFDQVDLERATAYAAEDADITLRLHLALSPQLAADERLQHVYADIEMPAREVLFRMERNGVLIDSGLLEKQSTELGAKMMALEKKAFLEAGQPFNLNSPKQIGEIFFEQLKLPVVKKTPSGAPSTDEEVLEKLALDYPLPKTLLEYRGLTKLKSTYTDKLPRMVNAVTGRVHTNYGQATAVTGRLASNDPNLQNIPVRTGEGRRIREAFIAPPGHILVSADYSQIELRIMAHLSRDPGLLKAFAAGEDVHRATAAEIFNRNIVEVSADERRAAKTINFGLIYGMSAFGLAIQLNLDRTTAQAYIDNYFARYPGVKRYMDETRAKARDLGYVETVLGRRLWLQEIRSSNPARRQGAERAAINAPMQGTAADLIKLAMIAVQHWLDRDKLGSRLIMQV
ncbi:MAG: DNA polymerase I, partial [Proteobacteria bacterium]|nr:DNA polymerase I [Pseudomonadota bacterium]